MKIGFTIGKFAPLHKGHEFLLEKALKEMDEFYTVIYDTPELDIDIDYKIKWFKNKYPNIRIICAYDSPKEYGLSKEKVEIQMRYLQNIIGDIPVKYFYSSEEYGYYVAKYMNINHVLVDKKRVNVPISASLIRENPLKYKKYLDKNVYNDLVKILNKD